jgi:hypothetical protein
MCARNVMVGARESRAVVETVVSVRSANEEDAARFYGKFVNIRTGGTTGSGAAERNRRVFQEGKSPFSPRDEPAPATCCFFMLLLE